MNQTEAFTDEHHFVIESAVSLEILLMIAPPSFQIIILPFGKCKTLVHIAKAHLCDLQGFDKQSWRTIPVKGNVPTSNYGHCFPVRPKLA